MRIRSGKSPASTPMPRTAHILGTVLPLEATAADGLRLPGQLKLEQAEVSHSPLVTHVKYKVVKGTPR